jgi:hypothetical protein
MQVEYIDTKGSWREVANAARTTIGMEAGDGEPSSEWKTKILKAEHSPIRLLKIRWKWVDLKSWISVHFVRHKFGVEHFVRSQRNDRQDEYDRDSAPQSTLITHEVEANAQAIINISRKRLCKQSHPETVATWIKFLEEVVRPVEPELYDICVRECIYRGHCTEMKSCGYSQSMAYSDRLFSYEMLTQ